MERFEFDLDSNRLPQIAIIQQGNPGQLTEAINSKLKEIALGDGKVREIRFQPNSLTIVIAYTMPEPAGQ